MQNLQTNCTSGAFTLLPKYVLDVIMLLFAITKKSYNGFSMICNISETKAICKKRDNLSGTPAKHECALESYATGPPIDSNLTLPRKKFNYINFNNTKMPKVSKLCLRKNIIVECVNGIKP